MRGDYDDDKRGDDDGDYGQDDDNGVEGDDDEDGSDDEGAALMTWWRLTVTTEVARGRVLRTEVLDSEGPVV